MTDRLLVVAPSWVGDCVMAQPLLRRLKEYRPDSHLTVFAPAWTLPLFERMPEVDATLDNPFGHGQLRLGQRWRMGRSLRGRFEQVIVLPNSLKSALLPWFAGIGQRTGFVGESRYGLLNDVRQLDASAYPLLVDRFALLAEPRDATLPRPLPYPALQIDPASRTRALASFGLATDRPIAAFCPGAEYGPAKRWPARHVAELARRLEARGFQVWLFGSTKDREETARIVELSGASPTDLAGRTTLAQAIDLLSLADLVITNDSGLMHVAAALQRPLVALFGSSSPDYTPPLSDRAEIVSLDLDCSPCFERVCPLKHFDCLEKLGPELAEAAIDRLLSGKAQIPLRPVQ
ncbi:lipopolysaccharide heptosyltransferase II [Chitinimonas lacunae]|uniref:lipopolysaccharide heptosyltransferase II n=1 Tax=Chitinimonas lacunae TaxID=1963018 RepID=A0ABV8MP83_9NEIS